MTVCLMSVSRGYASSEDGTLQPSREVVISFVSLCAYACTS